MIKKIRQYLLAGISKTLIVVSFLIMMLNQALSDEVLDKAKQFVSNLSQTTINIIENSASDSAKEQKLRDLFISSVDHMWMGKFAIGNHWRSLESDKQNEYLGVYKEYLIKSYVPNFKKYNKDKVNILDIKQTKDNEYLVSTEIIRQQGEPIKVNYQLRLLQNSNGEFRIFDIIAEGVSLIITQRSDFGSIIARSGIDGLIDTLKQKINGTEAK